MAGLGNQWLKCDFHLHTKASGCFIDKNESFEDWIKRAKEQGLDCVAVTDHNSYKSIDELMELGKEYGITVFPGVEVTCDTSKIHVLCIFDKTENEDTVRDFLATIGINSKNLGSEAWTEHNIFEVCEEAKKQNALVIAAHIDEYSGISYYSDASLRKAIDGNYFDAFQVVNSEIWEKCSGKDQILEEINKKYRREEDWSTVKKWKKAYDEVKKKNKPIVTFSDNPLEEGNPKHGLWGIGQQYTWIKTVSEPTIDSIKQALIMHDGRIKTCFECPNNPEQAPNIWVKSVSLNHSHINQRNPLNVEFCPQLNTIIGGRGTGKSSVIRLIGGATASVNRESGEDIFNDQMNFYRAYNKKNEQGALERESVVEVMISRDGVLYKVVSSKFDERGNSTTEVYRINAKGDEEKIEDSRFIEELKPQVFTQKEIYEIGRKPNSLLKIIDDGIPGIEELKNKLQSLNFKIVQNYTEIHEANELAGREWTNDTDKTRIEEQLQELQNLGVAELNQKNEHNADIEETINEYFNTIDSDYEPIFQTVSELASTAYAIEGLPAEIEKILTDHQSTLVKSIEKIQKILEEIQNQNQKYIEKINNSKWKKEADQITQQCEEYEEQDLDYAQISALKEQLKKNKEEAKRIAQAKKKSASLKKEQGKLINSYTDTVTEIRKKRTDFIKQILGRDDTLKISFMQNRNKDEFEDLLRQQYSQVKRTLGLTVIDDIDKFMKIVFENSNGIELFKTEITKMREGDYNKRYSKITNDVMKQLDQQEFNKMLAYIPSDEIRIEYKPSSGSKTLKSLSTASAGQKTACILNIILSYGNRPLLLDQPEDDLDNKLVFDLIVKKLKVSKANRQVIVVTHNANIPVNGDAECVISMDSADEVKVKTTGSIDDKEIRDEICNVMEGSEQAFKMRAKKYGIE